MRLLLSFVLALAAVPAFAADRLGASSTADLPASAAAISHYVRSRMLLAGGDPRAAAEELQIALAFDEGSPELRVSYAETLAAAGESARAESEARQALDESPSAETTYRARLLAGRVAAERKAWSRAAGELQLAVKAEAAMATSEARPPRAVAWRTLALVRDAAGDEKGASRALEDLARRLPAEAGEGYVDLGDAARAGGEARRAERLYRRAVSLRPGDVVAWKRLASLEESVDDAAGARASWERAVQADPDDEDALLGAGRLAADAGDVAAADGWFHQLAAVARDPDAARVGTALAWLDADRREEALALLDRLAAETPDDPRLLFALGAAEERAGRPEAALARMRAVLAAEPDHAEALNFIAYELADRGERLDEADALVRRALSREPESAAFLDTLGWVEFRRGRLDEAAVALERAERLAGKDATISEHLGDVYRRLGRRTDAAAAYRRALSAVAPREPRQRAAIERKLEELVSLR